MDGTVLIADDDRTIRTVLSQALTRAGCKVHTTASLETLMRWLEEGRGDVVITDVMMPDGNGIETLPKMLALRPGLPVIVISAQNTIMTAVKAEEAKAWDYLPKPFDLPDLLKRTAKALGRKAGGAHAVSEDAPGDLPLVGRSAAMQGLYRLIAKMVNSGLPVLLTGESGTGKSLIARVLHDVSDRGDRRFILAGGEDLRSTEAAQAIVARAGAGTLCLDEVGDLSPDAQMRAVRLIDGLPDGGPRIIATMQGDAEDLREDLYYRLSGVTLVVPPLRERLEDIPLFAAQVLGDRRLSAGAMEHLRAYPWPGNVRQLLHVLRRLAVTASDAEIPEADVSAALASQPEMLPSGRGEGESLSASIAAHLQRYFDLHGGALPPPGLYGRILREMETPLIEIALDATGGNQAKCADLLGINRNTLRKKITDLEIEVTRRRRLM
ncbi:MAG: nitrogen regulation protein NR(I) [Proteobacteria bacterium]|nr:MAG: nitrogen regulation protein NR(I) [Pseudomonadota bacterium]